MTEATLNTKNEQAMTLLAEIKKLVAEGEERSSQRLTELEAKHDEAVKAVREDLEKATKAFSVPGADEATDKGDPYSLGKAMRVVMTGDKRHGPMEAEMNEEIHSKAMSFGVDTSGGFLVPAEITGQMIDQLFATSVAAELGATTLSNLDSAPVPIPRIAGGPEAYWGGEASSINLSDLEIEQLNLNPHDLFALTAISEKLLRLSGNPSIEALLRRAFVKRISLKIDKAVLAGTGASGEPIGIINASGVSTSALSDPGTYNEYVAFISAVRGANALDGRPGWAMSNADMTELEQIVDTDSGGSNTRSQIHERRRLLSEDGERVLGYPAKVSTQLTDGQVIFGNWEEAIIAQWGPLQLAMTNALGFQTAQTHVRALTWADVGLAHGESFCRPT